MNGLQGEVTLESMNLAAWYNQWTLNKFRQYLAGDILEVGCGIGNFTKTLANYGSIWAMDINDDYIKQTRNHVDNGVKIGIGDIEEGKYFFGSKKFDSIVCINVLEHIENDSKALSNLYNLLKKGGKLILMVPSHPFLYGEIDRSIGHFRRYKSFDLIKRLKELNFQIIESRKLNLLGAISWFIAGRVLKGTAVKRWEIKIFDLIAPFILPFESIFEPPIGTSILAVAGKV